MQIQHPLKRTVLLICLILAPLFQLIGDAMWLSEKFTFGWSVWREASYIFFVPAGILIAKLIEPKSVKWAITCAAFFITGCFGAATMMPLFRLGAYYPSSSLTAFPEPVQTALSQDYYALTIYPPGLCFPVSLVLFGIAFLKYKPLHSLVGYAFVLAGLLFWFGNALEMIYVMVTGDVWLLALFGYIAYAVHSASTKPVASRV